MARGHPPLGEMPPTTHVVGTEQRRRGIFRPHSAFEMIERLKKYSLCSSEAPCHLLAHPEANEYFVAIV